MEQFRMTAPCLFGIEGILSDELKRMGAADVVNENGRVNFTGDFALLARANIRSRYAERILILMGTFPAQTFEELFQGVLALPWEQWIGSRDRFPVKGWSLNSKLNSVPACQSIVKKAIVERMKRKYRVPWFEETGVLFQVQFSILKDQVSVMIDTSGEGLHKRGYRPKSNDAPIKETLAAAIAWLAHVYPDSRVIDPCCGSGTLLIESALHAMKIAPGLRRNFAAEKWSSIPAEVWRKERMEAAGLIVKDNTFTALGSDIDETALALTAQNAAAAGVGARIETKCRDLSDFSPEGERGIVLCNPPYGERMLDVQQAEQLYRVMGKRFVPQKGWSYYIISPHERFEELFGRRADRRRKLYNGMLKCQVYMYFK